MTDLHQESRVVEGLHTPHLWHVRCITDYFNRLVEQQAAVQRSKEDFMSDIRVSLRTFRRTLDDTLQLMRESNAMFIKSFK